MKINSSFAKLIKDDEFEVIFNIDPGKKITFNEIKIILPDNFTKDNYKSLEDLFVKLKDEPYSINSLKKLLTK